MKDYPAPTDLPQFENPVITTGSFDGVHTGHALIIEQLLAEAHQVRGTPVIITFYPHPKHVVPSAAKALFTLNTPEEKYRLLREKGIEHIAVVPFDSRFAAMSASEYIENFLVAKFHPKVIVTGYDHRFGQNRSGDFNMLRDAGRQFDFEVKEIPGHVLKDVTVSSTKIREALLSGETETAASLLGYDYFFSGKVVEGNRLGRTIGYPTANIHVEDSVKLIPANGVYAVRVALNNETFGGMMNIGVRPTINGSSRVIEVHLFDFEENIYDSHLTVTLAAKLRDEKKFNGLDELKSQLARDKDEALSLL